MDGDHYLDASVEPPQEGAVADLKYLHVGGHLWEFVSGVQVGRQHRWDFLRVRYPGLISDTPTNAQRQRKEHNN